MNARRTSGGVLAGLFLDDGPNIAGGFRSSYFAPGANAPVKAETLAMPVNHRSGLNNQKRFGPGWPYSAQQNPKQAIGRLQSRPRGPSLQDNPLLRRAMISSARSWSERTKLRSQANTTMSQSIHLSLYQEEHSAAIVDTHDILATYRWY